MLNLYCCTQPSQHSYQSDCLKFVSEGGHLFPPSWALAIDLIQAVPPVLTD